MRLKLVLCLAALSLVTHDQMAGTSNPLPAQHLSAAWSMNIKPINAGLALNNSTGIRITCELCWNRHEMEFFLCSLVMNARRDTYRPRRKHEISSRALIISLGVLNALGDGELFMYVPEVPAMSFQRTVQGSQYFLVWSTLAARTVWILPLASPCFLLSCISVPSTLIQKPSEVYLWAAGEEGTLLWK